MGAAASLPGIGLCLAMWSRAQGGPPIDLMLLLALFATPVCFLWQGGAAWNADLESPSELARPLRWIATAAALVQAIATVLLWIKMFEAMMSV